MYSLIHLTTIKNLLWLMDVLIKNQQAFTIQDGKLVRLGFTKNLQHIVGNVFKAESGPTYVIDDLKVFVLSEDSYPLPIVNTESRIPERIVQFKRDFQTAYKCKEDDKSKRLYSYYDKLSSSFSTQEFEDLIKHAVVLEKNPHSALYRRDSTGNYIEQRDIVELPFDEAPAFLYHGGLYGNNGRLQYTLLPLKPLILMPKYIIFWGGRNNLFALVKQKDGIEVKWLGVLQQYFETPHGMIVEVEEKFIESSAIYNFGPQNLERIFSYSNDEDFDLDKSTGVLTYYRKTGYVTYAFKKGHYVQI